MESITDAKMRQAVEEACRYTQDRWESSSRQVLSFHHVSTTDDWDSLIRVIDDIRHAVPQRLGEVHGILVKVDSICIGFCTFYLAYDSWDGRVISLDLLQVVDVSTLESMPTSLDAQHVSRSLKFTVADIGLRLGCTRFAWQQCYDPKYPSNQPENEWLTIHMDREAMTSLVKNGCMHPKVNQISTSETTITAIINCCLNEIGSTDSNIRLRLATVADLAIVERLVQGLAHFEKMPDAIHVTQDHYRRDGFPTEFVANPLFYCILLEDSKTLYAFGMAFICMAHSLSLGRFVYLEDLFVEEEFRGLGGGTVAMEALARICLAMDYDKIIFQAIDWNTPALNFYAKLGGKVCDGLRIVDESLVEFCKQRPTDC